MDEAGLLYAADESRVQVFDTERRPIGVWNAPTSDAPGLYGVVLDGKGSAFVGAPFTSQIYKLRILPLPDGG